MIRNFLWNGKDETSKLALVKWEKITLPLSMGGLGIRDFRLANLALLGKLAWNVIFEQNCLWVKVLRLKYLRQRYYGSVIIKRNSSYNWKALKSNNTLIKVALKWVSGNDRKINFWHDSWFDRQPLRNKFIGPLNLLEYDIKVYDLIEQGNWNLSKISFDFLIPLCD